MDNRCCPTTPALNKFSLDHCSNVWRLWSTLLSWREFQMFRVLANKILLNKISIGSNWMFTDFLEAWKKPTKHSLVSMSIPVWSLFDPWPLSFKTYQSSLLPVMNICTKFGKFLMSKSDVTAIWKDFNWTEINEQYWFKWWRCQTPQIWWAQQNFLQDLLLLLEPFQGKTEIVVGQDTRKHKYTATVKWNKSQLVTFHDLDVQLISCISSRMKMVR